uniref:Uncharacterized protein n=1 Tax=Anguilla anguilla TaxID=7936 RepID=A0A0E9TJ67_ANGAN
MFHLLAVWCFVFYLVMCSVPTL